MLAMPKKEHSARAEMDLICAPLPSAAIAREAETSFHVHSVSLCLFIGELRRLLLRDINIQ